MAPKQENFIPALGGVRGVAACWVVGVHVPTLIRDLYPHQDIAVPRFFRSGYLGVDLFFVLSGFILTYVYAARFRDAGLAATAPFYVGRLLRIWPLNIAVLAVLGLVVYASGIFGVGNFTGAQFVASLFLVQHWIYLRPLWNFPAWSLSVETLAYIVFPLLVILIGRIKSAPALIAVIALSIGTLDATNYYLHGNSIGLDAGHAGGFSRCLFEFTGGIALCYLSQRYSASRRVLIACDVLSVLLLCICILTQWAMFAPFAFCGIVYSCAKNGAVGRLLGTPVCYWLGEISFSLYLTHWVTIFTFERVLKPLHASQWTDAAKTMTIVLCVATVFLVAVGTWRLIERPSHAFAQDMRRKTAIRLRQTRIGMVQ